MQNKLTEVDRNSFTIIGMINSNKAGENIKPKVKKMRSN
jgi:hypothetical protein